MPSHHRLNTRHAHEYREEQQCRVSAGRLRRAGHRAHWFYWIFFIYCRAQSHATNAWFLPVADFHWHVAVRVEGARRLRHFSSGWYSSRHDD